MANTFEDVNDCEEFETVKLIPWIVCGRTIGQATGWDQADTYAMTIYGFIPCKEWAGPKSIENLSDFCIHLDFEKGLVQTFDDDGNVVSSVDLLEALKDCPKAEPDILASLQEREDMEE